MNLSSLIITRIIKDGEVTLSQLEHRATERGVLLSDLYAALERVHRDRRITRNVSKGEVVYSKAVPKSVTLMTHLIWVRENYPYPDKDWQEPFPEIDLGAMFLRTKEERDEYKAAVSGRPVYMVKSRYDKSNTR
jgi:hypothetical protein